MSDLSPLPVSPQFSSSMTLNTLDTREDKDSSQATEYLLKSNSLTHEATHQYRRRTAWSIRIGWYGVTVLFGGTLCIIAALAFLCLLWTSNSGNNTWRHIMLRGVGYLIHNDHLSGDTTGCCSTGNRLHFYDRCAFPPTEWDTTLARYGYIASKNSKYCTAFISLADITMAWDEKSYDTRCGNRPYNTYYRLFSTDFHRPSLWHPPNRHCRK